MKQRSATLLVLIAALVMLPFVTLFAIYSYDSGHEDQIAEGVSIGGVDVGGMSTNEARTTVRSELARPLERPVEVRYHDRVFTLTPERARLRTDVGGMVAEALDRSREGSFLGRGLRDLTGGGVDADIRPRLSYDERTVKAFAQRIERKLERPARDATVEASASGLTRVPGRNGLAVNTETLRRAVKAELLSRRADHLVTATTRVTKPKVTTAQLEEKYPYYIIVDRSGFQLKLYTRLELDKTYTIAVGQVGFDTPSGVYHIQNKAIDPAWNVPNKPWAGELAGRVIPGGTPENPLKARWMGIFDGAGIHGTDQTGSLGSRASHGCIRMAIPEVKELYDRVPVQTPVYIA